MFATSIEVGSQVTNRLLQFNGDPLYTIHLHAKMLETVAL